MIGLSENFPKTIHSIERYDIDLAIKKLQKKLIKILEKINHKTYCFEEITHPTIPDCKIIFEIGLAEEKTFNFIDEEEKTKYLKVLRKETFKLLDLFISIRYYRIKQNKRTPLNFDYYLMRIIFDKKTIEIDVFHERGPRHILPKELIAFIISELNKNLGIKIKKSEI